MHAVLFLHLLPITHCVTHSLLPPPPLFFIATPTMCIVVFTSTCMAFHQPPPHRTNGSGSAVQSNVTEPGNGFSLLIPRVSTSSSASFHPAHATTRPSCLSVALLPGWACFCAPSHCAYDYRGSVGRVSQVQGRPTYTSLYMCSPLVTRPEMAST